MDRSINLTISAETPLWSSKKLKPIVIQSYSSYTHTINAIGGYWSASISFPAPRSSIESWFVDALGRDLSVYNPDTNLIFNGFINSVRVNMGGFVADRGPLKSTANRVKCVYSTVDTDTDPPTVGNRSDTDWAEDTDVQDAYGIIEKILSVGGATDENAEQIRDTYLNENKHPESSETVSIGASSGGVVTLGVLGYVHFLELFSYNDTVTGTRSYTNRITDVLAADPNGLFSTDYSEIETNASTVPRYTNDDKIAWQIIKSILSKGDSSFNRWVFGVYGSKRKPYYNQIPSSVEYYHRIADRKQRIMMESNIEAKPWDVLPAKWLNISDWLIGDSLEMTSFRNDTRNIFIESVIYTAPYGLQINGNKINTLPQMLGSLGLSGVGA